LRDTSTWVGCTPQQISELLGTAPDEDVVALLGSPATDWIVEPGRLPGGIRLRNLSDPSFQMVLMPGLTSRPAELGRSPLEIERQRLLLAAAERTSLWDLHLASPDETRALIKWGIDAGLVAVAAEIGQAGHRTGEWVVLSADHASGELADARHWSAGPYPSEGAFAELFVLLTSSGTRLFDKGAADNAIAEAFARRHVS